MRVIYADNNATTQVAPEVLEAMTPYLSADYFNPSSMYEPARRTATAIAQARQRIAGYLGAGDPKQIVFTSCATESNNTAIFGTVKANPHRRPIITTTVEHPAVLEVCKDLERVVSLRRGRSDALSVKRLRDLRLQRFRLHFGVAGAFPCLESHARPVHRRSRIRALQLQPVQHVGRWGADHPGLSPDRG